MGTHGIFEGVNSTQQPDQRESCKRSQLIEFCKKRLVKLYDENSLTEDRKLHRVTFLRKRIVQSNDDKVWIRKSSG